MLVYFSLICTIDSAVVHTLATRAYVNIISPTKYISLQKTEFTQEELAGKQNIILYQFKLFSYVKLFYQEPIWFLK
jgi:hypothetical protein